MKTMAMFTLYRIIPYSFSWRYEYVTLGLPGKGWGRGGGVVLKEFLLRMRRLDPGTLSP